MGMERTSFPLVRGGNSGWGGGLTQEQQHHYVPFLGEVIKV